jgi:hypothetical protein
MICRHLDVKMLQKNNQINLLKRPIYSILKEINIKNRSATE